VVRRERQIKGWSHAKKEALAHGELGKLQALANNRSVATGTDARAWKSYTRENSEPSTHF
jgi:hypothetical protein